MTSLLPNELWTMIFKKLPVEDQLNVSEMSLKSAELVQTANINVKTLVITNCASRQKVERKVDKLSLASLPSMQLALSASGNQFEPFDDYPKSTDHPSKWGYLQLDLFELLDPQTINLIVTAFSAVSDLKFYVCGSITVNQNLTAFLEHTTWKSTLSSLMIHLGTYSKCPDNYLTNQLIAAVNNLSELQNLAIIHYEDTQLPVNLTKLAKLKFFYFDSFDSVFLPSLKQYATKNDNLKIIHSQNQFFSSEFLNNTLPSKLIRIVDWFIYKTKLNIWCDELSSLTAINVVVFKKKDIEKVFRSLARLPRLVYLNFTLESYNYSQNYPEISSVCPLKPLSLVQALDLNIGVTDHSKVKWINFEQLLPRLQAIHVFEFCCKQCNVLYKSSFDEENVYTKYKNSPTAIECFRTTLTQLHLNIPYERIIIGNLKSHITLRQLLNLNNQQ